MRFFFYGTLIEPEILHAVLRRPVAPAHRRNAVLRGYRRVYRQGASYPVVVADPASDVEGIVVSPLTTPDVALLTAYEGPEYEIRELTVKLSGDGFVGAKVFMPRAACEASRTPWTPDAAALAHEDPDTRARSSGASSSGIAAQRAPIRLRARSPAGMAARLG